MRTLPDSSAAYAEGGSVDPLGLDPLAPPMADDFYPRRDYYPQRGFEFAAPSPQPDPNLPTKEEGPMAWVNRLIAGDKKAGQQAQMGLGGLGLLASLLDKKRKRGPGFRSIADLRNEVSGGSGQMSPQNLAKMQAYFSAPAARPGVVTVGGQRLMAEGGEVFEPGVHGPYVSGEGSGQDDAVDARLSSGEYVFDADVVAALGDGSNEHGARVLDEMRQRIREHKRGAPAGEIPPRALSPLEYMNMGSK